MNFCKVDNLSPPDYEIIKEGWLTKKNNYFENHARKWVVLAKTPSPAVICFKTPKKKPRECSLYFLLADVEFYEKENYGLAFKRVHGGSNKWSFYTQNILEYNDWVKNLNKLIDYSNNNERGLSNFSKWTLTIIEE